MRGMLLVGGMIAALVFPAVAQQAVTVQLKWIHQAQFAGFYVAESEGFYEEEGLDVTFLAGGVGIDLFEGVVNGDVDFSIVGADALLQRRADGDPVVALATTYRVNPVVFAAFADSGIESPYDFPGKSIAMTPGYDMAVLQAMLQNVGVDVGTLDILPYAYNDRDFLEGKVDITVSFAAGSLPVLRSSIGERALNVIWPNDYGVHFYSDTIVASEGTLAQNPDMVLRFLRATLQGHLVALSDPQGALDATMAYAVVQDRSVQASMLHASIPLIYTGENHVGWMDPTVWQGMYDILYSYEILSSPFDVSDTYTLRFLEAIYSAE